jgi:hypothetical protein
VSGADAIARISLRRAGTGEINDIESTRVSRIREVVSLKIERKPPFPGSDGLKVSGN